jgi:hypothetical protein
MNPAKLLPVRRSRRKLKGSVSPDKVIENLVTKITPFIEKLIDSPMTTQTVGSLGGAPIGGGNLDIEDKKILDGLINLSKSYNDSAKVGAGIITI